MVAALEASKNYHSLLADLEEAHIRSDPKQAFDERAHARQAGR
jgi:hypothetical protein